jgi:hypothetical protein
MDKFITLAGKPTITKDPQAVLDYTLDFSAWLPAGDTIVSHTTSASGVAVDSSVTQSKAVVLWVSGGVVGQVASVTVRITTAQHRVDDRTIYFKLKQR